MGLVSPSQSNSGDTIEASDINNPINQLAAVINGNIDANNITDSSITTQKLATNTQFVTKAQNPYKFSVYLGTAQSTINGTVTINFDTKSFDTGSNVDITTNKGRFTAPVAGFYSFMVGTSVTESSFLVLSLYKNGSQVAVLSSTTATNPGLNGSKLLSLAANDYIEAKLACGAVGAITTGAANSYFEGFLVSAT